MKVIKIMTLRNTREITVEGNACIVAIETPMLHSSNLLYIKCKCMPDF